MKADRNLYLVKEGVAMSRIKILTTLVITAITLFLISGCATAGNQNEIDDNPYDLTEIILDDTPILGDDMEKNEVIENEISSYDRAQDGYSQTTLSTPELWSPREVEISDFGRQVTKEFLEQFESIFMWQYLWMSEEGVLWWGDGDVWINRFGYEAAPEEVPFIKENLGMIASHFKLFDLDYDGIPEIVITFVRSTTARAFVFKFIDGQYREIASDVHHYRFFYNQYGDLLTLTGAGAIQYFYFDDEFHYAFSPNWSNYPNWEAYGLTEILPLTDLAEDIRKSITTRFLAEMSVLSQTPFPGPWPIVNYFQVPDSQIYLRAYRLGLAWADFSEYIDMIHCCGSGGEVFVIWVNIPTRNFALIEVSIGQGDEDSIYLYTNRQFHLVTELPPEMPFVVSASTCGGIPTRGISFLDENDEQRYFLLSISGYDGSIELMPYSLDERLLF